MKLIVPFSLDQSDSHLCGVQPETLRAVRPHNPRFAEVTGPAGYHDLLSRLWAEGEGFVLVEQDIVPWPRALPMLWACPMWWCAYPYAMRDSTEHALGCTKFSRHLVRAFPEMVRLAGEIDDDLPAKDWRRLDVRVEQVLMDHGFHAHRHEPAVGHLNPAQQLVRA